MKKLSYAENQQLLKQEKLNMIFSYKTYYNLLHKKLYDYSNSNTITDLFEMLQKVDFVC